jgi:colanic acid/amylovoran biosynthesis glycosyltransferase
MRILVFVERFISPTLLFIYNEVTALAKTHEVMIITTAHLKEYEKDFPFPNITVIPYKPHRVSKKINWLLEKNDVYFNRKNRTFSKKLNSLISSYKPDIIHGHFGYESLIMFENMTRVKCPVFVSFHGYDASEMLKWKCYIKKLNYYIDNFNITPIYVSNYMRKDMENAGIHLQNARLLYYGTDKNYFKPVENALPNKTVTFLQISSFNEKKGHTYTLQAFKKFLDSVDNKNIYRLILAGGGPLLEKIKNETETLGLKDFVEFTGAITYKETLPLLQKADIFLHHSITGKDGMKEGIPNAIMEAMAMELPVISTFHAGIPELVEDGVNGYLVKEKDVDSYARRMNDILSWKRLPVNRQKVYAMFSREKHNQNLIKIYAGEE